MKKLGLFILLAAVAFTFCAMTTDEASALPAFSKQFAATYKDSKVMAAAKEAKCNLCHVKGEKKTVRNAYGKALSKYVTKDDYKKLKSDKPALKEKIEGAFAKAADMEGEDGKTFGEQIEAGELPK